MARVIQNLVYRVSVSAIVGAIVAGGLIYLNNERVIKSLRTENAKQVEMQDMTNRVLMESSDAMASAISVIEAENIRRLEAVTQTIQVLSDKIDNIPTAEPADLSEVLEAITALDEKLTAQIENLDTTLQALQEKEQ